MLSISESMICYKNSARRRGVAFTAPSESHALTPIRPEPFIPAHFHAKYTLLFTVYCYSLFRVANRTGTMPPPRLAGRFQVSQAVICFIRSLLTLKVGLCRHLTELVAFRFGSGQFAESGRVLSSPEHPGHSTLSPQWLPNGSFQLCLKRFFLFK